MKRISTILSSIKSHSFVFSGTYLISSTVIDFRILSNYNDAVINFMFSPIIFWLSIITKICLQIRTKSFIFKNMQIMECLKNYQLRKDLGNNIFLYRSFLFDSVFHIKSQILWKQMTLTNNPIPHAEGGRRGRYCPIV